eukprot:TRINITY_DN4330_c0_g1_i2.p1 TRINITY_DN4330_c0_g1~~TRINITY_DN4330_c0_g1_i2.p1  ORF type:complete len:159 (+),score=6.12 TRINITY_DN4330_c0_g1_i2:184-660(+)
MLSGRRGNPEVVALSQEHRHGAAPLLLNARCFFPFHSTASQLHGYLLFILNIYFLFPIIAALIPRTFRRVALTRIALLSSVVISGILTTLIIVIIYTIVLITAVIVTALVSHCCFVSIPLLKPHNLNTVPLIDFPLFLHLTPLTLHQTQLSHSLFCER